MFLDSDGTSLSDHQSGNMRQSNETARLPIIPPTTPLSVSGMHELTRSKIIDIQKKSTISHQIDGNDDGSDNDEDDDLIDDEDDDDDHDIIARVAKRDLDENDDEIEHKNNKNNREAEDLDDEDDDEDNLNVTDEGKEDPDPLNSGDDVSEEDPHEIFDTDNVIICQYEKLTRIKARWKFHLKEGVMSINGKDYLFGKANGDAEW